MNYKKEARKLADRVLEKLEKESGEILFPIDPFKLLKQNNIIFTFSDFEKLEGIILNDEDNVTIVGINRLRPWTRQRFTAAHEYCHYIKDLKKEINKEDRIDCLTNSQSQIEKFADEFASHLLIPTFKLKELCDKYKNESGYIDFENITLIAEFFGVSFRCCLNRIAYELNMIKGDTSPRKLTNKVNKYNPEKKRKELIKNNNDYKLLGNIINSLSYCMIDLNNNTGVKFLNNYIYYDNKLEGIIQEDVSYILADLSYNKENSQFYNSMNENIIMTLGNYRLQEYVLTTEDKFDLRNCKKLHQLLNSYTPYPEFSGNFRDSDAIISKGTIQPKNYLTINEEINILAEEFDSFWQQADKMCISEYIQQITYFMYKFIIIHPFADGNGRISRALLNWMLRLKKIPPIYIDDKSRNDYYEALSEIDLHRNYIPLIILIEKRIINTLIELHDYLFIEDIKI